MSHGSLNMQPVGYVDKYHMIVQTIILEKWFYFPFGNLVSSFQLFVNVADKASEFFLPCNAS